MKYKNMCISLLILFCSLLMLTVSNDVFARSHAEVVHKKDYAKFVRNLPKEHARINISGKPYYFHNGVFYKKSTKGYVVVKTPVGARVKALPRGHTVVRVGGKKYYKHLGVYFDFDPIRKVYVVVGTPTTEFVIEYPSLQRVHMTDGSIYDGIFLGGTKDIVELEAGEEIWEIPVVDIEYISFSAGH